MKELESPKPGARFLPLVPLRDMVVFPRMMAPFVVGRASSIGALEAALANPEKQIFLSAQKDPKVDEPSAPDIHELGVVAAVVQSLRLPNGHIKVMVEGIQRGRIRGWHSAPDHRGVVVEKIDSPPLSAPAGSEIYVYMQKVLGVFEQFAKLSHQLAFEGLLSSIKLDDPDTFADTLAGHLPTSIATAEKQALLETVNPLERLQKLQDLLEIEIEKINIDRRINNKVKKQMERAQKEYYLNEKIKAIHQELGKKDDKSDEIEELRDKIEKAGMPKEVKEKAMAELKRLEAMPNVSAEATVSRNYIDWLVSVPWKKATKEMRDIKHAERILNEDHFGLEKIKERILEFLAVRQLVTETKGSILCFVGPPGVGKTSLAKSIAKSLNRKFVRLSLGGVRDEAEIRGHRRTYIGAFPGQIIQLMKKAGTVNPVFLLDEVDKMSMDFRGDPSSALLEVLDPEQNNSFVDHYLDVEYDLSKVMFIATANVVHPIPPALKDRMEIIQLSGYTPNEKLAIAKQFLLPKQMKENGLAVEQATFDDAAIYGLIESYTREAGVRNLEREIASVCRKIARKIVGNDVTGPVNVVGPKLHEFLGKPKFRLSRKGEKAETGLATGLAWTEAGGDVLHVETTLMRGKGNLVLTGQLGDVMQESARAALSYVRTRAEIFGAEADFYEKQDIHVHVPEGAIPKDGPSAGITMATSILSAVTKFPVRKDVAMTGEITLRGKVLPVGGIKEKLLAAYRAGITTLVLPKENEKDLDEIPEEIRNVVEFHLVEDVDEVLRLALEGVPQVAVAKEITPPDEGKVPSGNMAH
ncbi:MAG: endopeptidase La [Acidobacteria bacterium]|nr:endopeptidase La [Acidobacteriota bacterium]MCG3193972.1 Lon protease [Thermoanaerobaculia bacterium]MCK6682956.1 endopeptidase La [Thermoanaerobaculia bacterium]